MQKLVGSIAPCEVHADGRVYLVRRPKVGEAISILETCEAVVEGDALAWRNLRRIASPWLGLGLGLLVFSRMYPPKEAVQLLLDLLKWGFGEQHAESAEKTEARAKDVGYGRLVAIYADRFKVTPTHVLMHEDWPVFTAMTAELDSLRAMEQISNASWYAGAKTGNLDSIERRAFGERVLPPEDPWPEERVQRQYKAIRVWREKQEKRAARKADA